MVCQKSHLQERVFTKLLWKKTFLFSLLLLVISSLIGKVKVFADDTEDLLNVYNLTLGGITKNKVNEYLTEAERELLEAEKELLEAVNELEEAEKDKEERLEKIDRELKLIDTFNELLKKYEDKNKSEVESINLNITKFIDSNKSISKELENNLLELNINDLLSYDMKYKSNIDSINTLVNNISFYNVNYTYKDIDYDIDEIVSSLDKTIDNIDNTVTSLSEAVNGVSLKIEDIKLLYANSLDTFELGEVKNIKFPVDRERYVSSKYGYRVDPIVKNEIRFHGGTDYRCSTGTELYSLFNGVCTSAGWSDVVGWFVIIQHGENIRTAYYHMSELKVKAGDVLKQYDLIGLSGGTGQRSTGPHLHLSLYINGNTYDVDKLFQESTAEDLRLK